MVSSLSPTELLLCREEEEYCFRAVELTEAANIQCPARQGGEEEEEGGPCQGEPAIQSVLVRTNK